MDNEKAVRNFLQGISELQSVYFVGSTTKNAIGYKADEEIEFKIRVSSDQGDVDVPWVSYVSEGDDGQRSEGYIQAAEDGWFYLTTTVKCAGFVHLIARACDENKNEIEGVSPFEGGAGAEVESLESGTDIPEDYMDFWAKLKAEVWENEPELLYCEKLTDEQVEEYTIPEKRDGFEFYDMHIRVKDDMYVSCVASYPIGAKPESLKLAMYFRGYGIAAARGIGAQKGYLSVLINAHSIGNFEPDEYYQALYKTHKGGLYGWDVDENKDPETTYWKTIFMRNMQALRYFSNHELFNKKDYIFAGGSQGAMQAINMAVHSGVECECTLSVPWFADLDGMNKYDRIRGWRPDFQNGLAYFDSSVAAKFLKYPVAIGAGLGDYVCPPSGIFSLYNGIKSPKKMVMVQNKQHGGFPEKIYSYAIGDNAEMKNSIGLVGEVYEVAFDNALKF